MELGGKLNRSALATKISMFKEQKSNWSSEGNMLKVEFGGYTYELLMVQNYCCLKNWCFFGLHHDFFALEHFFIWSFLAHLAIFLRNFPEETRMDDANGCQLI